MFVCSKKIHACINFFRWWPALVGLSWLTFSFFVQGLHWGSSRVPCDERTQPSSQVKHPTSSKVLISTQAWSGDFPRGVWLCCWFRRGHPQLDPRGQRLPFRGGGRLGPLQQVLLLKLQVRVSHRDRPAGCGLCALVHPTWGQHQGLSALGSSQLHGDLGWALCWRLQKVVVPQS